MHDILVFFVLVCHRYDQQVNFTQRRNALGSPPTAVMKAWRSRIREALMRRTQWYERKCLQSTFVTSQIVESFLTRRLLNFSKMDDTAKIARRW
jgi:hypothetical protein